MEIISRQEALAKGDRHFFTGKPCKHGHLTKRYVSTGACDECLHPKSTALAVISTPGEIVVSGVLTQAKLDIQLAKLNLEQQKFQLQLAKREDRLALQLQNRAERQVKAERRSVAKTKLVEVRLFIAPEHYEMVLSIVWSYAVMKNPLLRRDEIVTGKEPDKCLYVMKCFPEDKPEILRITGEIFSKSEGQMATVRQMTELQNKRNLFLGIKAEVAPDDTEFNDSKWSEDPK